MLTRKQLIVAGVTIACVLILAYLVGSRPAANYVKIVTTEGSTVYVVAGQYPINGEEKAFATISKQEDAAFRLTYIADKQDSQVDDFMLSDNVYVPVVVADSELKVTFKPKPERLGLTASMTGFVADKTLTFDVDVFT